MDQSNLKFDTARTLPMMALREGSNSVPRRLYWLVVPQDCRGPSRRKTRQAVSAHMLNHLVQ